MIQAIIIIKNELNNCNNNDSNNTEIGTEVKKVKLQTMHKQVIYRPINLVHGMICRMVIRSA